MWQQVHFNLHNNNNNNNNTNEKSIRKGSSSGGGAVASIEAIKKTPSNNSILLLSSSSASSKKFFIENNNTNNNINDSKTNETSFKGDMQSIKNENNHIHHQHEKNEKNHDNTTNNIVNNDTNSNINNVNNTIGNHHIHNNFQISTVITYLIQRLQLNSKNNNNNNSTIISNIVNNASTSSTNATMTFCLLSNDTLKLNPVLEKTPLSMQPMNVTRRRRTTTEEINDTIRSLTNDTAALVDATVKAENIASGKAERVANIVFKVVMTLIKKKWWAELPPMRKKWILAIRKVIRKKLVNETKLLLKEKNFSYIIVKDKRRTKNAANTKYSNH
jgi:hypothetical protein